MIISKALLRTIFGAAREHSVSNEEIHDAIKASFNKTSLKEITTAQALQLLDGIRGGTRNPGRRRAQAQHGRNAPSGDNTEYLVNDAELKMLMAAAAGRGWSDDTLEKFCLRQIGVRSPRTMTQFNKIFWAIKAMNRRDECSRNAAVKI